MAVEILTLLANQQEQIRHSPALRFSLVTHLFTRVLPFPEPIGAGKSNSKIRVKASASPGFWTTQIPDYETKMDVLRSLMTVYRHFISCSFQLGTPSRRDESNDGLNTDPDPARDTANARVIVSAMLLATIDSVLRDPKSGDLFGWH